MLHNEGTHTDDDGPRVRQPWALTNIRHHGSRSQTSQPSRGATALAQRRRQLVRHLEFSLRGEPRVPITLDTLNRAHDVFTDHWDTYAKSARTHRQREYRDLCSVLVVYFQTLFATYIASMGGLQNVLVAHLRFFTHVMVALTQLESHSLCCCKYSSVSSALLVASVRSWLADYDSASEVVRVQLLTTGAQFNTAERKQ